MKFSGKTVLVTGGSRGIGAAIVELFAKEGAFVCFTYKSSAQLAEDLAKKTGGKAYQCGQDNPAEISRIVDEICAERGRIDILVNNAGITKDGYIMLMGENDFKSVIDTNLTGAFLWTKAVMRKMYAKKSGSVVFVSSVSGLTGVVGQANYAASKGAMLSFMRVAAAEGGMKGIRVNAVAPGFVKTDMTAKMPRAIAAAQCEKITLKRFADPVEIARAVLFLAGDEASYITGQCLVVDGGLISHA